MTFVAPQYLRIRTLLQLVTLDVLENIRLGRNEKAVEAFEAGWTINQSLRKRPELLMQLAALAEDDKLARASRKIRDMPQEWQHRIVEHDYRRSIHTALEAEALMLLSAMKHQQSSMGWLLIKPYLAACEVESVGAFREIALPLQRQEMCDVEMDTSKDKISGLISWWNFPGRVFSPNPEGVWGAANKTMLRLEGTQKILQVKEKTGVKRGDLRTGGIPGLESSLCRGAEWHYECHDGKEFSLTFSKPAKWLGLQDEEAKEVLSVKWSTSRSQPRRAGS